MMRLHSQKSCSMSGYNPRWMIWHRAKTVNKCVGINIHVRQDEVEGDENR